METFKDSSEYVSLVFNNYFNAETCAWREENSEIIASIFGVGYEFHSVNSRQRLRGLYLCGIATKPQHRCRGLMSDLLEEINSKAKDSGYDFTFLIPSDNVIRGFYRNRGYVDAFYKLEQHFIKGYNFENTYEILTKEYNEKDRQEIIDFLLSASEEKFENKNAFWLVHTYKDWEIVLREAIVSEEEILIAWNNGKIVGVAFLKNDEKRKRETIIKELFCLDEGIENSILKEISIRKENENIILIRSVSDIINVDASQSIWSPFYGSKGNNDNEYEKVATSEKVYNKESFSTPFGMIRVLDIKNFQRKILGKNNTDFKDCNPGEIEKILFRKPLEKHDELEKLLNLPRLDFSMSLLLE